VSNTPSHEPITCPSCEYRYPQIEGTCPMCGKAAPAVEPLQPVSTVADEFSGADHESRHSSSGQPRLPYPGLRKLSPLVVVLITVMVVGLFLYNVRKRNLHTESGSATEPTATSPQPKPESTGERHTVHNPVRGVHVVEAKLGAAEATNATKVDDPVELWKAVKRGNVSAEVALANLYLEGNSVPQNCGQAHTLLHAASLKGSKAADTLLKSSYAERCE
jgi:hypothetical protein